MNRGTKLDNLNDPNKNNTNEQINSDEIKNVKKRVRFEDQEDLYNRFIISEENFVFFRRKL